MIGQFLLSPTREASAAKCFFLKALHSSACSASQEPSTQKQLAQPPAEAVPSTTMLAPRVMNVEKNAASPKAMAELKANGTLPESVELRQVNYFNTRVEQDPRFIKRRVKAGLGFFSRETAWRTHA